MSQSRLRDDIPRVCAPAFTAFRTPDTVHPIRPIDPVITFRNSQHEAVRGTLTNVQRRSLVMEIYNPYSIVQVSEVLSDLTIRSGERSIYKGKAVVTSLLNTGLMAVVSVVLVDEWSDLNAARGDLSRVAEEAQRFIDDWQDRFRISRNYQVIVSEMRAFLAETSRWADQADMSNALPRDASGNIRNDVFHELALPLMKKGKEYLVWIEAEAALVPAEDSVSHRNFAQSALHPLLLRAPFVYRTFAKPMGYAGDYEMVNQILADPRQGPNTYFQIVNTMFLKSAVAEAHRNRIDILVNYLHRAADVAALEGRQVNVLNVGCGPAIEIQRFIEKHPHPELLSFTLVDFSEDTLAYTRKCIENSARTHGKKANVNFVHESVHDLLKRAVRQDPLSGMERFDFVYCAGLFDYLSDKVCTRLIQYFVLRSREGGHILVTNVHTSNPERNGMEHILEWHLIYRDERQLESVLPTRRSGTQLYTDVTGVNVFAEFCIRAETVGEGSVL
ncbi:MAG: SAM-dependent methyltransferase [Polaromonas sp. 24-62-144]|jgi:extracellular factor (EF) 3-hydroxypalmitic acid methyl ester biosynthesis protein|nr:MAG: SAM-dependent methyltransferase [Polaromonas sp. 35-63-240]OYY99267.1 MAG: SAM-dependent methyltransferase [Polaromonas sp. 28-63-22]OYZ83759.1 MAG: SAM-dependent methyltransferase [Polaromonas sp. 24-62-144]